MSIDTLQTPVCYLCGSSHTICRRKRVRYGIKKEVHECTKCQFVYLWPRENLEGVVEFYKKGFRDLPRERLGMSSHEPDKIFETRIPQAQRRFDLIKRSINKNTRLLEIGSAAGSFVHVVQPHVKEVQAIELDPIFAQYNLEKFGIKVFEEAIESLDVPEEYFDAMTMFHVLEHLYDPVAVLKKLMKALKKGGSIYIEVPNIWDPLLTIYKVKVFRNFYYQSPHLYYFSPDSLKDVISRAGFESDIKPIQLYGFRNHLRWAFFKTPQRYQAKRVWKYNILDIMYRGLLGQTKKTDTLFAVIEKK